MKWQSELKDMAEGSDRPLKRVALKPAVTDRRLETEPVALF